MNDLEEVMWEAWGKVWPMLKKNPDELKARLARRRSRMFQRPMRAWCLAVKASDGRINPATAAMIPDDAAYPGRPDLYREHVVYLEADLLRTICSPVSIGADGLPIQMLAEKLGCDQAGLKSLRKWGVIKAPFGRTKPRPFSRGFPVFFSNEVIDPTAYGKRRADRIWGDSWIYRAEGIGEEVRDQIKRVPFYLMIRGRKKMMGWRWICPGCNREVRTIYYPLKCMNWADYIGLNFQDENDAVPEVKACFACVHCHGILNFSRVSLSKSWNQLILRYSGGLLYGKEVRRPAWLVKERKRVFTARPKKAEKQDELEGWLVRTNATYAEIARELGVKEKSVERVAYTIYKKHGVKSREELKQAAVLEASGQRKAAG